MLSEQVSKEAEEMAEHVSRFMLELHEPQKRRLAGYIQTAITSALAASKEREAEKEKNLGSGTQPTVLQSREQTGNAPPEWWERSMAEVRELFTKQLEWKTEQANRLGAALKHYARRYNRDGECWNWRNLVCDSYSGEVAHFDWKGDEQEEAWEIAERALGNEEPKRVEQIPVSSSTRVGQKEKEKE